MSYPTNDNTQWEPPEVETMVLPPRRRSIIREEDEDGNFEEKTAPLERWSQVRPIHTPARAAGRAPGADTIVIKQRSERVGMKAAVVARRWLVATVFCFAA